MDGFIPVERVRDELDELLRRVEGGESLSLTRDGQVVARLQPAAPGPVASRIRANRVGRSLGGLSIRELIDEGRP